MLKNKRNFQMLTRCSRKDPRRLRFRNSSHSDNIPFPIPKHDFTPVGKSRLIPYQPNGPPNYRPQDQDRQYRSPRPITSSDLSGSNRRLKRRTTTSRASTWITRTITTSRCCQWSNKCSILGIQHQRLNNRKSRHLLSDAIRFIPYRGIPFHAADCASITAIALGSGALG